jgi:HEPN domain-containing protein
MARRSRRPGRATPDKRALFRAAVVRLDSARVLFQADRGLDALYLSGYAVECGLKALILARTPSPKRLATLEEISQGARSHDYHYLRGILEARGCVIPRSMLEILTRLASEWSTDLRYQARRVDFAVVQHAITSVEAFLEWAKKGL